MSDKKPLFTVTARDCEWSYTKGSGNGGQKKNKTSSAVHCMHRPSGAHGYSEASRSQADNKQEAFQKMYESVEFQRWLNLEFMKRSGLTAQGCWDEMDDYDREAIAKFAELIVKECIEVVKWTPSQFPNDECVSNIKKHFGVEE